MSLNLKAQYSAMEYNRKIINAEVGEAVCTKGVFQNYEALYGTIKVEVNRSNPNGYEIELPFIKIESYSQFPEAPIFLLGGGPGESNLWKYSFPEWLLNKHDIIMVGYRGKDDKINISQEKLKQNINSLNSLNDPNWNNVIKKSWDNLMEDIKKNKIDPGNFDSKEMAGDIEDVRRALNYDKINLFAFSYGTLIADLYINAHESRVDRCVMLAARSFESIAYAPEQIEKTLINYDKLFTNKYKESFSIEELYKKVQSNLPIEIDGTIIDNEKLSLLTLKQLYKYDWVATFVDAMQNANKGNYKKLGILCKQIEEFYIENPNLIDIGFKRAQLNCSESNSLDNSMASQLSKIGNKWWNGIYNSKEALQFCEKLEIENKIKNTQTLFISAENDYVSPPESVKNDLLKMYSNSKFNIIDKIGHIDLLDNNIIIKDLVINFYNNESNQILMSKLKQ